MRSVQSKAASRRDGAVSVAVRRTLRVGQRCGMIGDECTHGSDVLIVGAGEGTEGACVRDADMHLRTTQLYELEARVHQIPLTPAPRLAFGLTVTDKPELLPTLVFGMFGRLVSKWVR